MIFINGYIRPILFDEPAFDENGLPIDISDFEACPTNGDIFPLQFRAVQNDNRGFFLDGNFSRTSYEAHLSDYKFLNLFNDTKFMRAELFDNNMRSLGIFPVQTVERGFITSTIYISLGI